MPDTKFDQTKQDIFQNQPKHTVPGEAHSGVMQEERAGMRARSASTKPARSGSLQRAVPMDKKLSRSQNPNSRRTSHEEKREQITLWVKPIVKSLLLKKARGENLPISLAGAAIFERAIQQDLDVQYGALLEPILERGMVKNLREEEKQTLLLSRMALDIGQVRAIVVNILGRMPGMTQKVLATIIRESENSALANATHITPQVIEIIKRLDAFISGEWKKMRGR